MTTQLPTQETAAPHDRQAEQQVIGALLIDRDAIFKVADLLRPDDFFVPAHQRIYTAALALLERRERIDPLTIQIELARKEQLDLVGGPAYLRELADLVPTAVDIERHGHIVHDRSMLRSLLAAARATAADAYSDPDDVTLALDRAEQRIFALRDEAVNAQLRHILTALHTNYDLLTERMEHPFDLTGTPSGFREIDGFTEGFNPGDLVVIAARPSVGKTSLGLAIAHNVAKRGETALVFSLEMDAKQIVQRFLGMNSRTDLLAMRTGNVMDSEAASALMGLPILLDDTPGLSIMELRTKARRATAQGKLSVIVVDYLQLMRTAEHEENRVQEVATITRNLKALARELGVTVIALSQLSRAAGDAGNEPKLSTLRECVTGDTLVVLADGRRTPIRELVGSTPTVASIDARGRLVHEVADCVWAVGRKPVFDVRLASGRSIRATAKHRLLAFDGWRVVSELRSGDRLRCVELGDGAPAAHRRSAALERTGAVGLLDAPAPAERAASDLFWDEVVAIEPAGEEEVFDLTVPATASWIADGIVSHNSGAIEQDSDVVIMLWRDKEDTPPGAPQLIRGAVAKNRNGPTGHFELFFEREQARFFSRADDSGMPV